MKIERFVVGAALALSCSFVASCGSSSSTSSNSTSGSSDATSVAPTTDAGSSSDAAPVDVCKSITTAEVSAIVGGTVTNEAVPGGGCRFPQSDVRAPTAAFDSVSSSVADGSFETAKYGVTATIKGESKDLDGVGDKAVVVVGTTPGGSMPQGGGLVQVGSTRVQVTLIEGTGMSEEDVTAMTTKLLELAASKG